MCLIVSTIYIVILVSGFVGSGPSVLHCPGHIMLLRRPRVHTIFVIVHAVFVIVVALFVKCINFS